jgi:hypothetical protein
VESDAIFFSFFFAILILALFFLDLLAFDRLALFLCSSLLLVDVRPLSADRATHTPRCVFTPVEGYCAGKEKRGEEKGRRPAPEKKERQSKKKKEDSVKIIMIIPLFVDWYACLECTRCWFVSWRRRQNDLSFFLFFFVF